MGELVVIQQPRRGSPLPAVLSGFGILGSSKGNTYAVGSGGAGPAPAVTLPSPEHVAAVLQTLNTIASPEAPQKITATGDTLRTPLMKAQALRPPPPPPPQVIVSLPYVWPGGSDPANNPPPLGPGGTIAPGPAFPGGGGGAAAAGEDGAPADAPVFLGLTQTQLLVAGGLGLAAWLLLRKKKPGARAAEEPAVL